MYKKDIFLLYGVGESICIYIFMSVLKKTDFFIVKNYEKRKNK